MIRYLLSRRDFKRRQANLAHISEQLEFRDNVAVEVLLRSIGYDPADVSLADSLATLVRELNYFRDLSSSGECEVLRERMKSKRQQESAEQYRRQLRDTEAALVERQRIIDQTKMIVGLDVTDSDSELGQKLGAQVGENVALRADLDRVNEHLMEIGYILGCDNDATNPQIVDRVRVAHAYAKTSTTT